ncbi:MULTISPECIES: hypothetical protein [Burkholderia]|uniref:Lipoprotein n=1 Tax=Burkholderia savannae TaxID=1637837 RepID=A0ABR5TCQ9_9BURK|nr:MULTISPECIES: hypothetical protein [Burkholderia]AOJ80578.1 hypothetical protein WS86_08085 [Burkholderia savannae]KVK73368.1 hypothetical protein WS91_21445 [Burkholderia sp. MSMB1498]KWZ42788.1 hypothetical protein WS72_07870 [Burkholderia savannae]
MRPTKMAFALALACAGFLASDFACAQRSDRGAAPSHKVPRGNGAAGRSAQPERGESSSRAAAVPPDLEQRRRDGHMTPEERHLLRQHIEDAVRELYKR